MEHQQKQSNTTESTSPFGTFDAMSLAPVDIREKTPLTISPAQTSLQFGAPPSIKVEPPRGENGENHPEEAEKKQIKKRKSWGQELPVPKTNLPPRKRAKTDDEKEQRRIERVLRNRAAAQTSRERKRLEVEKLEDEKKAIERENTFLMERLNRMEAENNRLNEKIAKLSGETPSPGSSASPRGTTPLPSTGSPTLTPILFKKENDYGNDAFAMDRIPFSTPLSIEESTAEPSDLTQHPAAVLCDLQCQSEASTVATSMMRHTLALQIIIAHHVFLMMTSAAYLTVILPMSQIFHSLKEGSPLTFSPEEISRHLPLILWLISTPTLSRPSPAASGQRSVFRMRILARLLDCRPAMARPLKDATSRALQLALREMSIPGGASTVAAGTRDMKDWRLLMTMMWAIGRLGPKQRPRYETRSARDRYIHDDRKGKQFLMKSGRSLGFGTKRT